MDAVILEVAVACVHKVAIEAIAPLNLRVHIVCAGGSGRFSCRVLLRPCVCPTATPKERGRRVGHRRVSDEIKRVPESLEVDLVLASG